jgi:undecaprenyl diphosphate synthase
MSLKDKINSTNLPEHIAIIMDGNGRWAKKQGEQRIFGHHNAVKAVREATEGAAELGIKFLTLYAFSTENWGRPQHEVNALMELLVDTINSEIKTLMDNNVRLKSIGNINGLPLACQQNLRQTENATAANSGLTLVLALNYSGRWEIVDAVKKIALEAQQGRLKPDDIDEKLIAGYLNTSFMPDPELLIRTSGEMRVSNYLLWQIAYTEFFITETLWPDFTREDLYQAIIAYQARERRFGKVFDI